MQNNSRNDITQNDLLRKLLDTQMKELEVRQQEEENKRQIAKINADLAKQSLQLQANDKKEEREYRRDIHKRLINAGTVTIIFILLLMAFALYANKENFIIELIKILIYGGSGIITGASWQKLKQNSEIHHETNQNDK